MEAVLFVADDIQPLAGGKLLVVGLYADRVLSIARDLAIEQATPGAVPAVNQMCLMVTLIGLPVGKYEATTAFVAPDGSEFAKPVPSRLIDMTAGRSCNLLVKIAPFATPLAGSYKVVTSVGEHRFENSFEIRFEDRPAPPQSENTTAQ
jgi:hypothetical protein